MCQAPQRIGDDHTSRRPSAGLDADRSSLPVPSDGPRPESLGDPGVRSPIPRQERGWGALVEELLGRLHRPPKLLASFIRHTAIPIRLRTESDTLRRLQYFGVACFGLIDEWHLDFRKRFARNRDRKTSAFWL